MGTRAAGILVTHTDVDHIGGVAALADGTGAEVWAPAGEVEALRTGDTARRLARSHRTTPRTPSRAATRSRSPASPSRWSTCPATRRPTSRSSPTASSSPATCSSRARSAASTSPGGDWETLLASVRSLTEPIPARHRRLSRARPGDDARPRAPDEPVSARAASPAGVSAKFQAPRGTHDVLPTDADWWHVVRTMEEVTALYGWGRIQTPGFEDTGPLHAHRGRGLRRRAQGDVHVHRSQRPFADAAAGGNRADRARVRRARAASRAAAREGVHDRADVPLRRARHAGGTASTTSCPSRRSARPTRRSTPRSSSSTSSCSAASA